VRAARGEIVRLDTPIYGRAGSKETIIIDASLFRCWMTKTHVMTSDASPTGERALRALTSLPGKPRRQALT
jgi:hypothetical protein